MLPTGATGTVSPVATGKGKACRIPWPRGGLVYVDWDGGRPDGVFKADLVSAKTGKRIKAVRQGMRVKFKPTPGAAQFYSSGRKKNPGKSKGVPRVTVSRSRLGLWTVADNQGKTKTYRKAKDARERAHRAGVARDLGRDEAGARPPRGGDGRDQQRIFQPRAEKAKRIGHGVLRRDVVRHGVLTCRWG